MVIEAYVNIPATAIVAIHIKTFHVNTLDPSRFPIGSKLNAAKKLLMENPTEQIMNIVTDKSDVNAEG